MKTGAKKTIGRLACGLILVAAGAAAGCADKLETGYVPRKLGSSTETRRGFYAQPFSVEAQKAKAYEQDFGTPGGRPKPAQ